MNAACSVRRTAQRLIGHIDFASAARMSRREAVARARVWSLAVAGTADPVLLGDNTKLEKSGAVLGRPTMGVSLTPSTELGTILADQLSATDWLSAAVIGSFSGIDSCPWASDGCRDACLFRSGHGQFDGVALGRAWRTAFLLCDPVAFVALLMHELRSLAWNGTRTGSRWAVRLNVTSDVNWLKACPELVAWIVMMFGRDSLYDYSKDQSRVAAARDLGYDVSTSRSETTDTARVVARVADGSLNRAVVVFGIRAKKVSGAYPALPSSYMGLPVVDGDVHDYRPADGRGVIVGLRVKDTMGRSTVDAALASGFAVSVA